jgi:tRNA-2-methylthio-N6-dimethylallyladenosine synthase
MVIETRFKKLFVETHGCQMNEYDSNSLINLLQHSHQLELTQDPAQADVLFLNTCSIREKAQHKVSSQLGQWRLLKMQRPHVIIGVGGCVASQEGMNLRRGAPFVDVIFGPQTLHRVPKMLDRVIQTRKPVCDISFPEIEKFDCLPQPRAEGVRALVSIMEGCNKYCSFCVVPYTRGEEISRPLDDVLAEIVQLAQQGVREVTLLGQNVNDYRGARFEGGEADLAMLIEYVAAIDSIERIRFTTSHPLAFSDRLIAAYAQQPKLANHLHLPVQSGSDRILVAMKRGYTALEFKSKIRALRKVRPDISITSDFIIGFPGETEQEFQATMKLISDVGFDGSFSFIYSRRPGTPAAQLPDTVPLKTKKARLEQAQDLLKQQHDSVSQRMLNSIQNVLIDGVSKKNSCELQGRTENNRVVNLIADHSWIGQIKPIRITEILPNSLRGEIVTCLSNSPRV